MTSTLRQAQGERYVPVLTNSHDLHTMLVGIEESLFPTIEAELFSRRDQLMGSSPSVICYDTTNFYTYIEAPSRSELARRGHSKECKHYLKHVGLLMAVEQAHGIPLMSRVYHANGHDSKVFSFMLADLILTLKHCCGPDSDLVLILDKGNYSQENFTSMSGQIGWIGAVVPSHHEDVLERDLSAYHGRWKELHYYRGIREVMGLECVVVLTFNPALKRKQEHTLKRGIEKLKKDPMLIRFRPIRHWTDSKIRAYAFCCVGSMLLMRVMQWKTEQAGYPMSSAVLKDEFTDLQEVMMVSSPNVAERRLTERSAVQHKLWKLFHLEEVQQQVSLHEHK